MTIDNLHSFGVEQFFRIGDIHQEQGISGNGSTRLATVFLFDHTAEALYREFAAPHFEQSAHYGANHVAQKTVGTDGKHPSHFVYLCPGGMHYAAVVGLHVSVQLAETGEVRIIEQRAGGFVHPFKVRLPKKAATVLAVERRLGGSHIIFIGTGNCIKTRMCIGLHHTKAIDGNVRRKKPVQLVGDEMCIQRLLTVKVCHHQGSMYTGISPTCPYHVYFTPQQSGERTHQAFLHAVAIRLYLPSVISGPIVS